MPEIRINDEVVEIEPGERILDVARRNALHIGFVCDGNGLCQMCECTVEQGMENLNPPTEAEEAWLTRWQIDQGSRLACQAALRGSGQVAVLTRAEDLRRQTMAVVNPPKDSEHPYLNDLLDHMMTISVEHVKRFPMNMVYAMVRVWTLRPSTESFGKMWHDTWRISNRLLRGDQPN